MIFHKTRNFRNLGFGKKTVIFHKTRNFSKKVYYLCVKRNRREVLGLWKLVRPRPQVRFAVAKERPILKARRFLLFIRAFLHITKLCHQVLNQHIKKARRFLLFIRAFSHITKLCHQVFNQHISK